MREEGEREMEKGETSKGEREGDTINIGSYSSLNKISGMTEFAGNGCAITFSFFLVERGGKRECSKERMLSQGQGMVTRHHWAWLLVRRSSSLSV